MATQTALRPQSSPAPRLQIMADARPHLTPFRRRVIRLMCATAAGDLGDRLKSATVWLWRSMEEEAQNLVLTLEAEANHKECHRTFQDINRALVDAGKSWSKTQWHDSGTVDVEVVSTHL